MEDVMSYEDSMYWYANTSDVTGRFYVKLVINGQTFEINSYMSGSIEQHIEKIFNALGYADVTFGKPYKRSKYSRILVTPIYADATVGHSITQKMIDSIEVAISKIA
jgi:hypothetical protein